MARGALHVCAAMTAAAWISIGSTRGDAHKPITSPFTFNEDVFPIVRERCGACHYPGGVAPMSLMTHADAVPWGESMRAELMAGHMPPWGIERGGDRFRNVQGLTARELNVLLTWASGGTPPGDPDKAPPPAAAAGAWPLGSPDLVLSMPNEVTIPADVQEHVAEFTVPVDAKAARLIRAIDLLPGTPAVVRSATISVNAANPAPPNAVGREHLLALWLPGDHPVPLDQGAAFGLPAGAELIVRIRYRKTWQDENRAIGDRSTIGIYFATEPASVVQSLDVAGDQTAGTGATSITLADDARLIALYPQPDAGNVGISVVAVRPDGSRDALIAFRHRVGWTRRYWLREPLVLPRGTRVEMVVRENDGELLPPGALPRNPPSSPEKVRLTLNVLPGT